MKNLLIVGGTGFLGFNIAKFCMSRNLSIISLSTQKPKKIRKLKKVKYLLADISKKKTLYILKKIKIDYVINCGGYIDHSNELKTYKSHYIGCKNLYEIFKNKNLKKFIQIGSSSEYGRNRSPIKEEYICRPKEVYGLSKFKATKFLLKKFKNTAFPVTVLRFYQVFGPYQEQNRFIPMIINGCIENRKFDCSLGNQSRDFLYVDDAVKAIFKTLKNKKSNGKIINIGSGRPIILKNVIKKIVKMTKGGIAQYGKIKLRKDEVKIMYPDINKAKFFLKWKSRHNFNDALKKTIVFYKKIKNL